MENCSSCPLEIIWEAIDSDLLFRHPKIISIQFNTSKKVMLPMHLQSEQDDIREFKIKIEFAVDFTLSDMDDYIHQIGYYIFDSNTPTLCWGTIYRRSKTRGYWALHAPCLYCYQDLIYNGASEEMLQKAALLSYL